MKPQEAPDHIPSRFIYELIEKCNYQCMHCFVPHKLYGPTTEQATIIADKVADAGVPSISWTGGEPYMRKDFFEIMEGIKPSDVVHTVNTNGSYITKEAAQKTAHHFALARVSIYGTPLTFLRNTGGVRKFDYETSMHAIKLFLDAGVPIQVNVPVISENTNDLEPITMDLEKRFGSALEEVVFIPSIKIGEKRNDELDYPSEENIRAEVDKFKDAVSFPVRYFMWRPGKHMVMKADMNIYAHPIFTNEKGCVLVGNILEESIEELWTRFPPEFKQDHRNLTPDVTHLKKK